MFRSDHAVHTSMRPCGPADSEKRGQILKGAREVFLANGFDGASMDQIAKHAGVSKGTLYVYFPSKESLFTALILEEKRHLAENVIRLDLDVDDPRKSLTQTAELILRHMLSTSHIQSVRMVIGATEKFPDIGRIFFNAGPAVGQTRLATFLANVGARGLLDIASPEEAASDFMALANSDVLKRALFGVEQDCSDERIHAVAERAVAVFMRAYAPAPAAG